MSALTLPGALPLTMSSLEIAELVDARHDNVKTTIERLAERGVISLPALQEVRIQRERRGEMVSVYPVGKRDSYVVVAQLSPEFTARLVDRWQELEAGQAMLLPHEIAGRLVRVELDTALLFGAPLYLAQSEAVKATRLATGVDFSHLLLIAPAQDNIPLADEMLEPTELGQRFGLTGKALNQLLERLGLQTRVQGSWQPTATGQALCAKHAWTRGSKSGVNWKWRVQAIKALKESECQN